ncbi:cell wall-binding repeat-containing protein [Desulfosporosinus sp. PR]|uniref:cell wall-binding repeat-containing protein n=1 Tax=Candidatus Desulfosporosinus nitrosoreducens TaxID=3401928 RepID=UPI0027EB13C8|nr:cell wall-binding repeat-containing protein [Desulfosporosinus sp. PR]MDQ7093925.1 cell wall-binding repeat-containing protein [Desulfosporosinus sp. PR]
MDYGNIKARRAGWHYNMSLLLILSVCILQMAFVPAAMASPVTHRIAGYTQYDTSSAIAEEGWTQSDYAVLAYGENFPDALAATPLAKKYNAPILLTQAQSLPSVTQQTLEDLKVKSVFIVGGTAVVSANVENQVQDLGITVTRLAGNDMYDTAIEIAKQLGNVQEIAVVSGDGYADALSIAPIAAQKNAPLIIVPQNYLTDSIKGYLTDHQISHTYLIGGTDQIAESVSAQFPGVERITGSDKYARNLAVLNRFDSSFNFGKVFMATGNGFADALAGGAYAATLNAPVLLVPADYSQSTGAYLNSKSSQIGQLDILGGEAVMPSALVQNYANSAPAATPSSAYSASEIAKKLSPSIVYIAASDSNGVPLAGGSGYIVDSGGKVVTNYQLIKDAYSAKVTTKDGKTYDVSKVLAYDPYQDIALLKIDAAGLPSVTLGDSDKISTGDKVYALGNTSGTDDTMSDGIVSTKSELVNEASFIQISAPISKGTSGGVLVNEQAEVIGTTTANVTDGQNLYLAIPANSLKSLLTQDINKTLAQLPHNSSAAPVKTDLTDDDFADSDNYLNSSYNLKNLKGSYSVMTIDNKSVRFVWQVNDYQSGTADLSIHGYMDPKDYANWVALLKANKKGSIMAYFVQINNDIAQNYPGKSFAGSVVYQDYYPYYASPQFPENEVTFAGGGKWLVNHVVASFYDLHTQNISDPEVNVPDLNDSIPGSTN